MELAPPNMAAGLPDPAMAKAGPRESKALIQDHAFRIKELQWEVKKVKDAIGNDLVGEDTLFLGIKDAVLVRYLIKATLVQVIDPDAIP